MQILFSFAGGFALIFMYLVLAIVLSRISIALAKALAIPAGILGCVMQILILYVACKYGSFTALIIGILVAGTIIGVLDLPARWLK